MRRDPSRLSSPFDLLVIGGGIYGAWTACEAARRGRAVALVEQADWGAGTSSASSKLIHGGLRYLEQGHVGLVRKGLRERALLARLAPHRVRRLRFLLPVYRGDPWGRIALRGGLWLYDRLAEPEWPFQRSASLGRAEVLRAFPFVRPDGLAGGLLFDDAVTDDARLTLEVVDAAAGAGAVAVNRARATALLLEGGRVVGAEIRDGETGAALAVRAGETVACTGPWLNELLAPRPVPVRRTRGVHLVLPALPTDHALLLSVREDRRIVFLVPWHGRTLLGTTDADWDGDPASVRAEPADVAYLLAAAGRALACPWEEADVIAAFAGVRTLVDDRAVAPSAASREWAAREPWPGLRVSVGGKLTSARADARALLGAAGAGEAPLPWTPPLDPRWATGRLERARSLGVDDDTARAALDHHGTRVDAVLDRIAARPELARRIVPDAPFCLAQAVHAVEEEMARSAEDVLRRRLPVLLVSRRGAEAIREVAALCGVPA